MKTIYILPQASAFIFEGLFLTRTQTKSYTMKMKN